MSKWNFLSKLSYLPKLPERISFTVPHRARGTIFEKWIKYWEALLTDYADVFKGAVVESKAKPYKTTSYFALGSFLTYSLYHNPTEQDYRDQVLHYQNLFGLVGKPVRNPGADVYLKSLESSFNAGVIRRFSFGVFCIIWIDNYDKGLGLYKAQCEYLKPKYLTFYQRIIDIGFWNKYWMLQKNMTDYDVNPNEWIDFSQSEYKYKNKVI